MKEAVIVSEQLRQSIAPSAEDGARIHYAASPADALRKLIECDGDPICAVFFISTSEFESVEMAINAAPPYRVEYSVHLFMSTPNEHIPVENHHVNGVHIKPLDTLEFFYAMRSALASTRARFHESLDRRSVLARLDDMRHDQDALIRIGRSLQTEKDPDKLLRTILMLSKKITGADAGSVYIVEESNNGKQIRFKYSHTFSKDLPLEEFLLPYNTRSIAGYVAVTGKVLNIPDVHKLSASDPVSFNDSFDKANNYRSGSMLVVPMRNHIDEIIGVIQLINSKEDPMFAGNEAFGIRLETPEDYEKHVVPFDTRYEYLMEAVAGQAAIAIENNRMIAQIQSQFEEFVRASVTAIESRDPATSGHSFRVAEICTIMARAINSCREDPYSDINFTETQIKELEYAALLHDFGKVYIDLGIFKKAKKLFPKDLENLLLKLDYLYRFVELRDIIDQNMITRSADGAGQEKLLHEYAQKRVEKLDKIKMIKDQVLQINEPTVTNLDPAETLLQICHSIDEIIVSDIEDRPMTIFGELERTNLKIKRGSLNDEERREIESHVTHTYNFVSRIPWPPEFKEIPAIALRHHEKLDGTGYPYGEKGDEINIQARIMAIADMYDALTATDRPYKKALPHDKAISILSKEAEDGKLDDKLLQIFISCNFDMILAEKAPAH